MHLQYTAIFINHLPGTVLGSGTVSNQGLPGPSGSLSALSHPPCFAHIILRLKYTSLFGGCKI